MTEPMVFGSDKIMETMTDFPTWGFKHRASNIRYKNRWCSRCRTSAHNTRDCLHDQNNNKEARNNNGNQQNNPGVKRLPVNLNNATVSINNNNGYNNNNNN